ncbi:MAG: hypothetical protein QOF15_3970 [Mycobacterium sp.]|nr:hypothetical protein [Mycobacterium sp.]
MDPEAARGNAFVSAWNNRRISPRKRGSASIAEWHTHLAGDWTQTLPDRPIPLKPLRCLLGTPRWPRPPAQSAVVRLWTDCGPDEGSSPYVPIAFRRRRRTTQTMEQPRAISPPVHPEGLADLGQTCPLPVVARRTSARTVAAAASVRRSPPVDRLPGWLQPEDRVTSGLGGEVLDRCIRVGVEERRCDADLADIVPKDRPRQFRIRAAGDEVTPAASVTGW